jgi:DNA-binding response OmpR family regulator
MPARAGDVPSGEHGIIRISTRVHAAAGTARSRAARAVRRLRLKIDDPFQLKLIHSVRGIGYRFDTQP